MDTAHYIVSYSAPHFSFRLSAHLILVAAHHILVTAHHILVTAHHILVTAHHILVTAHHILVTAHHIVVTAQFVLVGNVSLKSFGRQFFFQAAGYPAVAHGSVLLRFALFHRIVSNDWIS